MRSELTRGKQLVVFAQTRIARRGSDREPLPASAREVLRCYAAEGATVGYQHLGFGVSQPLTTAQLLAVLRRLVGAHRRVDLSDAPSESGADIVATVVAGDEAWSPRTLFECWSDAGLEELGPYPDLRFAVELWRAYGADSYCDFHPFADNGHHPDDPRRRFLACVKGQWWVATAVDRPASAGPGGEDIRLVRPVEVPLGPAPA